MSYIDALNEGLVALQAALFAAELYTPGHDAVGEQVTRASSALDTALRERSPLTVVRVDDRIVVGDDALPAGATLGEGLFERLFSRGAECLTIEMGLDEAEIRSLLSQLHKDIDASVELEPGSHVRFGFIQSIGGGGGSGEGGANSGVSPENVASLNEVWSGLYQGGKGAADILDSVVANICTTVAMNSGSMLPLASLKSHDEYTFVHTINVAILSAALGEAVGLDSGLVHHLTIAALLHDIGKRVVPRRVLNKKAGLSDAEAKMMRRHPLEGARLLFASKDVPELAAVVAYEHHMHANGTGYPKVTPGWKLNFASQIVQVADVFDALRTHRPYRAALSYLDAQEIMQRDAGRLYDKELVEVFFSRVAQQTDRDVASDWAGDFSDHRLAG